MRGDGTLRSSDLIALALGCISASKLSLWISCAPRTPKQYEIAEVRDRPRRESGDAVPEGDTGRVGGQCSLNREEMAIKRERWRLRGVC
jgi:hypothetical protein